MIPGQAVPGAYRVYRVTGESIALNITLDIHKLHEQFSDECFMIEVTAATSPAASASAKYC